jgi:hypothetical protein
MYAAVVSVSISTTGGSVIGSRNLYGRSSQNPVMIQQSLVFEFTEKIRDGEGAVTSTRGRALPGKEAATHSRLLAFIHGFVPTRF